MSSLRRCPYFYTHLYVAIGGCALSSLRRCPYFRGSLYTSLRSYRRVCIVLIKEVSLF